MTVDFNGRIVSYDLSELDELSPAYAASIHKSQGSEYPVVVIPLALQHYLLLERNLLYSAVTWGKQFGEIIAVPRPSAWRCAIARRQNGLRGWRRDKELDRADRGYGRRHTLECVCLTPPLRLMKAN